jgi:hypothetical protein
MQSKSTYLAAVLSTAFWLAGLAAYAQDEPDEMEGEAPAAAPAAPKKKTGQGAATADNSKLNLKLEQPAIRSVLEANPTTPSELLRAVDVLVELGRPELARPLMKRLVESKPDAKALAALAAEFSSAMFVKLAQNEALAPEAAQFSDAVLSAAHAAQTNPALLAKLVTQLGDRNAIVRRDAILGLGSAHEAAVGPLLAALAKPERRGEHATVRDMLARLGTEALGPMLALLESNESALKIEAVQVVGEMRAESAVPLLLAPALAAGERTDLKAAAARSLTEILGRVPGVQDAAAMLARDAQLALERAKLERAVAEPSAQEWRWDDKQQQAVLFMVPPADAAAAIAARSARDLYSLVPDARNLRLSVLAQLSSAKLSAGLDRPLATGEGTPYARVSALGAEVVEQALDDALTDNQTPAATAAAEILGGIGKEELLHRTGKALSPLARAARHSDRRLRFAAVDAILKLKPTRPFAGDGTIAQSLTFFAGTGGLRRAIVGHPRSDRGQQLVSLLAGMDYEGDLAHNSRQFSAAASTSPDYEVAFVHVSLTGPPVDDLLNQLRRDPRTADLPIGLIAPSEMRTEAERLARSLSLVMVVPPLQSEAALKFQLARIIEVAGRDLVTFAERQSQAAAALGWLAQLSDESQRLFDLQYSEPAAERALYVPALSRLAALVLANLPSAAAQSAIVDLAGRSVLPVETRRAAALAFRRSVRMHGVLLTSGQMREQYDRYNDSQKLDRDTQQVLASLLDTLENKPAADEPAEQP